MTTIIKKLQCKDIPTLPILKFLVDERYSYSWKNWCLCNELDVRNVMPNGFDLPDKLVIAKMRNLIYKGLVEGCACGCRGDFEITEKGLKLITN